MNHTSAWLLAQRHNWERLGDKFSGSNAKVDASDFIWLVIAAVGAVVAVWWLAALAKHLEGRSARPNPGRLFRELCKAHNLTAPERTLLNNLAEAAGAEHAANLFVQSDAFDPRHAPDEADAVRRLKEKLFVVENAVGR